MIKGRIEKLDICIEDLQKICKAQTLLKDVKNSNPVDNVEPYLKYILENRVVKDLEDVFYIVTTYPDIAERMSNAIKKYGLDGLKDKSSSSSNSNSDYYRYSGTYDDIRDVPGYGTEWNDRCIPDGVSIRGRDRNERC